VNIRGLVDRFSREVSKFGAIGLIAYIIDLSVFNFLRFADGQGVLYDKPLTAKVVSVAFATTFAFFGNRHWTFNKRSRSTFRREYTLFIAFNVVGMIIALTCLWISHYVLGFQSALADNISANGVGLILGTMFRFWGYHKWVFPEVKVRADI
jgi:putative flippase GtrA